VDLQMALKDNFQYPIEDTSDYGGRIVFSVLEEEQPNLGELAQTAQSKTKAAKDAIKDVVGGDVPGTNLIQQFKGGVNQALRGTPPKAPTRRVSLYLPVGLQFRDNVAYENTDLLSGSVAGFLAGAGSSAEGLKGADAQRQASLAIVRLAQKNQEVGNIARAAARVTTNPNSRALFKSVALREFAFTFKFLPCSAKEAEEVKNIIQLFREELYPEDISDAGISLGYRFPNRFNIQIEYNGKEVTNKILPCFLRDVSVTYNPSTMAMHDDGNFSEIDMSVSFTESRTLDRKQIEAGF
jgi:hypothetical protein